MKSLIHWLRLIVCQVLFWVGIASSSLAAGVGSACVDNGWRGVEAGLRICYQESIDAFVTQDCVGSQKKCEALEKLKTLSDSATKQAIAIAQQNAVSGINPGYTICQHLSGEVAVLKNEKKSEMAICQFNDKSAVDLASLILKIEK